MKIIINNMKIIMKNHKIRDKYWNKNIEFSQDKIMINPGDKILMIIKRLIINKKIKQRNHLQIQKIYWKNIQDLIHHLYNKY